MNDLDKCMQWLLERITVEKYEADYIKFIMIDYAKKYHNSEVKKLNIPAVMPSVCPICRKNHEAYHLCGHTDL